MLQSDNLADERINMNEFNSILNTNPLGKYNIGKLIESPKRQIPEYSSIQTDFITTPGSSKQYRPQSSHGVPSPTTRNEEEAENLGPQSQIRIQKAKIRVLQEISFNVESLILDKI